MDKLVARFLKVDVTMTATNATITVYPFASSFSGINVYVDDTLDHDYEVMYKDVPSADEIMAAIETLKRAGLR